MKNMMKEYLGYDYSDNHLKNFCRYWIKASRCRDRYESFDEWRKENDLDCLCFDGDLRADTLMSAWTPVKWVADCLNRDFGISFYKTSRINEDPNFDLRLLAEYGDCYLPRDHELVRLLDRFLELAELACNFILLPSREMNPCRYNCLIGNEKVRLYDEVPATLAHIFDGNSMGRFFESSDHVMGWVKSQHLEMGFEDGKIDPYHVRPLIRGLPPYNPKWLTEENEIREALEYMIDFLETRMKVITDIEEKEQDKDRCTDKLLPWWKRLDEIPFEDLDKMDLNMPDRLIMYMDRPYILLSVKKKKEYSARNIIDDIQFDVYESGEEMVFDLIICGSCKHEKWRMHWRPEQSCLEVFDDHHIEIPDDKTRKKYLPLLEKSRMLMHNCE